MSGKQKLLRRHAREGGNSETQSYRNLSGTITIFPLLCPRKWASENEKLQEFIRNNGTDWILVCVGMTGFRVSILVFCFRGNDGIKEVEIMKQKRDGAAIWACAGDKRQVV